MNDVTRQSGGDRGREHVGARVAAHVGARVGAHVGARSVSIVVAAVALAAALGGCYSFKGGSAPAHLSSVAIPQVEDVSGSGRATMRQDLTQILVRKFREDNSLRVVDEPAADSRLEVTITVVRDAERLAVSGGQELETVRGVTLEARVVFRDNVRRRAVYERVFSARSQYNIDQGGAGETDALARAIDNLSNDILLATVAQW
ncbi:MAG TPA: LPS assembly lipoprotein LptE [Candidatus Kapabacteria bacterium]|nr:LPS assembly lipoprotein LptE [Candidatus Kapabacteria bacterium]